MNPESLQVLLVEDSPTDARLFQQVFLRSSVGQWSLEIAERLSDAIGYCQSNDFDLVLLDLQLPDSEGLDTIAKFNEVFPDIPIIILTAFDDEELALQAMAKGAQDYLVKDQVTTYLLRRSIRYAMERSQIVQRIRDSEQATLKALEKERELNQLKSYFVSMVSHEFRNPLTALQLTSEIILVSGHQLTPEKKQIYARRMESTIQNMCQLLDEIMLLGKVETGNFEITLESINFQEYCEQLISLLSFSDNNKHPIILSCHSLPNFLKIDPNLFRHIFTNLISNAIKYSPEGNEVNIAVDYLEDDRKLIFSVSDRGLGIPEAEQSRLFNTFSRCSNVGKIQGTGLGLAIVKRCVDLWGGEIQAESQVDTGTKFTVTLPVDSISTKS
ncbi:hybrid sensor histidine kinase/response regulator [Pseudanabaena sp. ABRG5-3]|uniref:hybrid sensor histidine kinase/response regulator n=1 Tax=Pseudanabaena sp. ABRG5-3 TaxID=685565 RepID=UPI000DC71C40|nr:hybrid sensor histidine kinase/response regulator [Pseudanabaena sp. ABRG5-3]BBC24838.1 response regulator receiver sensor signal transduction histidine kinase [Pseudanabaena sp. ABRG5-3]